MEWKTGLRGRNSVAATSPVHQKFYAVTCIELLPCVYCPFVCGNQVLSWLLLKSSKLINIVGWFYRRGKFSITWTFKFACSLYTTWQNCYHMWKYIFRKYLNAIIYPMEIATSWGLSPRLAKSRSIKGPFLKVAFASLIFVVWNSSMEPQTTAFAITKL